MEVEQTGRVARPHFKIPHRGGPSERPADLPPTPTPANVLPTHP